MSVALVTGAVGINGSELISQLLQDPSYSEVWAVCRRVPQFQPWWPNPRVHHLSVDLLNADATKQAFESEQGVKKVTHVFFTAYAPKDTEQELVEYNLALLKNTLHAIAAVADLQHICLITGTKYYGVHLGPFKTPAKESDPRLPGTNFYYDQEDFLEQFSKGKPWTWSVLRPHDILGYAYGNAMNMGTTLAVYATICKELGLKFKYPGTPKSYKALYDSSDVKLISRMVRWLAAHPGKANTAYNCVNGDFFRWENLWPLLAAHFGLEYEGPTEGSKAPLTEQMKGKEGVWDDIVKKHNLTPTKLNELVTWGFSDWVLSREYDAITDMNKAKEAGFLDFANTEKVYYALFDHLRELKIIP